MAAPESVDGKRRCPQCYELVDPANNPCTEPTCPLREGLESEDAVVYPELARANLHRIHGEYKAAADVCRGILRRFPGNLTAHTMMGDIAAEDGRLAEAVEWYELALDLAPDRTPERRKLESARRRLAEQEAATTAEQLGIPAQAPRARLFAAGTVLFVALVGVGGFFLNDLVRGRQDPGAAVVRTPVEIPAPPVATPAPDAEGETASNPPAEPTAPPAPADDGSAPSAGVAAGPALRRDRDLLGAVRARVAGGDLVTAASDDPRTGVVTLTAEVQGADPRETAASLALAVLDAFPNVPAVTVRLSAAGELVLVADVLRQDVVTARDQNAQAAQNGTLGTPRPDAVLREEWRPMPADDALPETPPNR